MRRRPLLAGIGALGVVSLAGCLGGESVRLSLGETANFEDGRSLTVSSPTVQKSIVATHSTFLSIGREAGSQFVVVDVSGTAEFEPSSFVLERDGDVEEPPSTYPAVRPVTRECRDTCVPIVAPVETVDEVAVAYRADEKRAFWELDEETVARLSRAPELELQEAVIGERDGDIELAFTVENVGERDGIFRGLVAPEDVADVEDPFAFPVPVGETVTGAFVPRELTHYDPDDAEIHNSVSAETRYFSVSYTVRPSV